MFINRFCMILGRNPKKMMNTNFSGYTNSVNSDLSSNGDTEQLENAAPCVKKQSESDDTVENGQSHSSLEVNVSQPETEGSASNGGQNTESINGDKTQGSVDEEKEEEEAEEWLDILGSGQLKKKVSTWINTVAHFR
jgi:hypothetical protein